MRQPFFKHLSSTPSRQKSVEMESSVGVFCVLVGFLCELFSARHPSAWLPRRCERPLESRLRQLGFESHPSLPPPPPGLPFLPFISPVSFHEHWFIFLFHSFFLSLLAIFLFYNFFLLSTSLEKPSNLLSLGINSTIDVDTDPHVSELFFFCWIRIQEGPTKWNKISCFELRIPTLFWGLKVFPVAWTFFMEA